MTVMESFFITRKPSIPILIFIVVLCLSTCMVVKWALSTTQPIHQIIQEDVPEDSYSIDNDFKINESQNAVKYLQRTNKSSDNKQARHPA